MSTPSAPTSAPRDPAVARLMKPVNSVVERFIPSALIFAIVLSVAVAIMVLVVSGIVFGATMLLVGPGA